MSGIFLSYRRNDASGWAGRLYEHLIREWGREQVFMDIDTIAPGEDYREAITRTIENSDVVLVVIGPTWLHARGPAGDRRLDDPDDTHRAEVAAALAAPHARVVPVLVGGATMPGVSELPEPLKALAYRNAAVVEDRRFTSDVDALQATLEQAVEQGATQGRAGDRTPPPERDARHATTNGRKGSLSWHVPTALALSGMLLILVWAVLVPRAWHNEFWAVRVGVGTLLLIVVARGLWSRQWGLVLAGGIGGLLGFGIWGLQLASTHSDELEELVLPGRDGIPNGVVLLGVALVVAAGLMGPRPPEAAHEPV